DQSAGVDLSITQPAVVERHIGPATHPADGPIGFRAELHVLYLFRTVREERTVGIAETRRDEVEAAALVPLARGEVEHRIAGRLVSQPEVVGASRMAGAPRHEAIRINARPG